MADFLARYGRGHKLQGGLAEAYKAMADQITTADKQRLKNRLGELSQLDMLKVEKAIKVQLGLGR